MHASALLLLLVAAPAAPVVRADVMTVFSLHGPVVSAKPEPQIAAVRPRSSARAKLAMAPHVVIAPALVPAPIAPVVGPMAVADIMKLAGSPEIVTSISATAGPMSGTCDLTDPVQTALQANPDVRARLPMIPADQRTVANAIMVWNAGWLHTDDVLAKPAYVAIRDAVAGAVMAATADCRSQIQTGPRLVFLPDERRQTTVLALGSGQWTWQQVADSAATQAATQTADSARFTAANTTIVPHASLKTGEE